MRSNTDHPLQKDPAAILDIKEDIRDECSKLGDITNVVLYDKEPDGVVTVRFSDPEAAKQCVKVISFPSFRTHFLPPFLVFSSFYKSASSSD